MKAIAAVLWLDWRSVRRDVLVLAAAVVVLPLLAGLAEGTPVPEMTLAVFALPLAAALLGSTMSAGEPGSPMLRARALGWSATVLVRLAHRCVLIALLLVLGLATLRLGLSGETEAKELGRTIMPLLGVLGCTATASAFSRTALASVPAGLLTFGLALLGFSKLTGLSPWQAPSPLLVTLLALPLAWLTLSARTDASPLLRLRWGLSLGLGALAGCLLFVLPVVMFVSSRVNTAEAAWAWLPPYAQPITLSESESTAAWERLSAAGIACGSPPRRDWLPRSAQCDWLRTTAAALRPYGNPIHLPPAELAAILAPVQADLRRAVDELSTGPTPHAAFLLGAGSRSDLQLVVVSEALVAHDAGEPERAARALALGWRLTVSPGGRTWRGRMGGPPTDLRIVLAAVRAGVPIPREIEAEFARVNLRRAAEQEIYWSHSMWLEYAWTGSFSPRLALDMANEHEQLGQLLGEWSREGTCFQTAELVADEDRLLGRAAGHWQSVERLTLEVDLLARVLARRDGRPVDPDSRCAGTRWVEETNPDGSWSIVLEGGPPALRHHEPLGGPEELWRERPIVQPDRPVEGGGR